MQPLDWARKPEEVSSGSLNSVFILNLSVRKSRDLIQEHVCDDVWYFQ